jgi:hypothetical protein
MFLPLGTAFDRVPQSPFQAVGGNQDSQEFPQFEIVAFLLFCNKKKTSSRV